jgi:hypothetical protein
VLFRGGRRAPFAEVGADPGGFEAMEADVFGVVADSAPGEGVEDSALKAAGDSEDIIEAMLYLSHAMEASFLGRCW